MLIMLCGPSFCGKSTLAERLVKELGYCVVSPDDINARRGLWGGEGVPVEEWAKTHQMALAETAALLADDKTVVIDDTNCFRFLRDDYRQIATKQQVSSQLWVIRPPLEELQRRRLANDISLQRKAITDEIFHQYLAEFDWPHSAESPLTVPYDRLPSVDLAGLV